MFARCQSYRSKSGHARGVVFPIRPLLGWVHVHENGGFMYGNYLLSASMHLSWNTWNIDAFDKHKFIHVDIPSTLASRYM